MGMPVLFLSIAIAAEVAGTIALKYTDGFTRIGPSAIVVAGYGLSFWMLALVLKALPIGLTYAVWAAVGTALIAAIGIVAFGEPAGLLKMLSLGLIIAGVVGLNLAARALVSAPMARGADTRERLLDAAAAVVRRDGARSLTLEAVAAEAGVSKGGLLYHFRSKRELLDADVRRAGSRSSRGEIEAATGDGSFAHGYVRASDMSGWAAAERATEFGLLAAMVDEPAALGKVRGRYDEWQARLVEEADDPVQATVARLAADGLWLADLLGLAPPAGELRERVLARLLELAGELTWQRGSRAARADELSRAGAALRRDLPARHRLQEAAAARGGPRSGGAGRREVRQVGVIALEQDVGHAFTAPWAMPWAWAASSAAATWPAIASACPRLEPAAVPQERRERRPGDPAHRRRTASPKPRPSQRPPRRWGARATPRAPPPRA